ncbi:MAG: aquaporin [Candidatus Poribacteria bacterium]|nr:MAG: aquaporin [Candidatus Poribacteria bacterium]
MNQSSTWKPVLAELIGTFVFFTIGAGAICTDVVTGGKVGLLGIAIAHGFILANVINYTGPISGGHHNPAVTFGAWVGGKIQTGLAVLYVVAQLVGGVLAGVLLWIIFPEKPGGLGTPTVDTSLISPGMAVLVEAALTFFLVLSVYGTGIDSRAPNVPTIGGYGIGLTVMVDILMGGPLTGASMNPARTFGPGLVAGVWDHHWVYWVGPLLGGGIAGILYAKLFLED